MNKVSLPAALLVALLLGASCASVRYSIDAPSVPQPVSMTPYLLNAAGEVVSATDHAKTQHFKLKRRCWAMLFGWVNLTDNHWDLSQDLSSQLANSGGTAIVNLTLDTCKNPLWLASVVMPLIPNFQTIEVEGDVVLPPDP